MIVGVEYGDDGILIDRRTGATIPFVTWADTETGEYRVTDPLFGTTRTYQAGRGMLLFIRRLPPEED